MNVGSLKTGRNVPCPCGSGKKFKRCHGSFATTIGPIGVQGNQLLVDDFGNHLMQATPSFDAAVGTTRPQTLSSGLMIRQDIRSSVRFVMFETEIEECQYATNGGTIFVVSYRDKVYALTCRHVVNGFELDKLIITAKRCPKRGSKHAPIKGMYFPNLPGGAATDSDILDICVIDFKSEIKPSLFSDPPYVLDSNTICASHNGHRLQVSGYLKDKSAITEPDIVAGFAVLEYQDNGTTTFDPLLRTAVAEFSRPAFTRVTGISGAPVYDLTANALCGMVVRGSMRGRESTIHFLDALHILEVLKAIDQGATGTAYTMGVWQEIKTRNPQ